MRGVAVFEEWRWRDEEEAAGGDGVTMTLLMRVEEGVEVVGAGAVSMGSG